MSADTLPRRLRVLYTAVSEFPSTNGIKVIALFLIIATGFSLALASAFSANVSEGVLTIWLSALLAMLGVGWLQSKGKWETFGARPPVEDVAAVHGTPDAPETIPASHTDERGEE